MANITKEHKRLMQRDVNHNFEDNVDFSGASKGINRRLGVGMVNKGDIEEETNLMKPPTSMNPYHTLFMSL